jgi:hypothetical protein
MELPPPPAARTDLGSGVPVSTMREDPAEAPTPTPRGGTTVTAYRDGPFLVRGPFMLRDEDGTVIEVRRKVVPLCRCGRSRTRPLCDGTHSAGRRPEAEAGDGDGRG